MDFYSIVNDSIKFKLAFPSLFAAFTGLLSIVHLSRLKGYSSPLVAKRYAYTGLYRKGGGGGYQLHSILRI